MAAAPWQPAPAPVMPAPVGTDAQSQQTPTRVLPAPRPVTPFARPSEEPASQATPLRPVAPLQPSGGQFQPTQPMPQAASLTNPQGWSPQQASWPVQPQYQAAPQQQAQYQPGPQFQAPNYQYPQLRAPQHQAPQYPVPSPQYQPYPQQYTPAPAPKKSNRLLTVVVTLSLVFTLGLLGLYAVGRSGGSEPPAPPKTPKPTSPWKNDDYKAPPFTKTPPPMPTASTSTMMNMLEKNALYDVTLATPVRCQVAKKDMRGASKAEIEKRLDVLLDCLMRVWGPALEEAGFEATQPSITVYTSPITTPCGKSKMRNAMFCAKDQNLYFAVDVINEDPADDTTWSLDAVMAHEFAHLVQARAGIIPARQLAQKETDSRSAAYLLSRRNEAQADCMAGLFFASTGKSLKFKDEDKDLVVESFRSVGSDRKAGFRFGPSTHPTVKSREAWSKKGLSGLDMKRCNAYVVDAEEVA